ncbi:MAG TPA: SDR family oxidoreductase [Pyrinomonadaceae bacterium]|jgi:3-oxoacyl-[acyl-carrier protein] reductase|nr:SDR family oxidoreductase [Pyrinomonadaceae bacterium]
MRLMEGKVAIITGAARGIGRACAELFAAHGAQLVLSDIDEAPTLEAVEQIKARGGDALAAPGDVTASDFAPRLIGAALDGFGRIDAIINNAGYTWDGVVHKMTDEQWQAMLDVHLTAPFRIIRAAATYLRETAKREREEGGRATARKIVNVSSTTGTRGNAGQANYAAGKAGIVGVTKTLAKEWGQFNIQVNAVAFGFIETRLTQAKEAGARLTRESADIALGIPQQNREIAFRMIPMGRGGTPEEAAGAVLFFSSPLSDYVSGQVMEVTGGL